MFELAEALFQSIRMQLSVPRYKAIDVGRGATLDTIDQVLNNRLWLKRRFEAIRKLDAEPARLAEIDAIVNWTNPGPGGFYDDLGDPRRRPHLVAGSAYDKDPASFHGPMTAFDQEPDMAALVVPPRRHDLRPAALVALRRARPRGDLPAARRLHRRHVSGEDRPEGQRLDRGASAVAQAQGHETARV